jgi:hypothetical protein
MALLRFAIVCGILIVNEDRLRKDLLTLDCVIVVFRKIVKNEYPVSEAVESK